MNRKHTALLRSIQKAAGLIYPMSFEVDMLHRYLARVPVGDPRGPLVVETIHTLERAIKIARGLVPFNAAGF